jgi:hypothetical protein
MAAHRVADELGIAEEQAALDAQDGDPGGGGAFSAWRATSPNWSVVPGTRPRTATFGRDTR